MLKANVRDSRNVAIGVKYIGPTNTKGSRLKAFVKDHKKSIHTIFIPWDYELERSENYSNAAKRLAEKLGWNGNLVGGWFGNEFVCVFEKLN